MREVGISEVESRSLERESLKTIVAFFVFGALLCGANSLVVAGAQDTLAGTLIQTSTVLLANSLPNLVACSVAPYFMQNIPYSVRISAVGMSYICGALTFAMATQINWKLFGIGLTSFALGAGETTVSALTSFYSEICLTAFSAGTGTGFSMAPLYYMGELKTRLEFKPHQEFKLLKIIQLLMKDGDGGTDRSQNTLSSSEKFRVIWRMLPHLLPLFIAWFADYLTIQAVVTTLAFPNAPFEPRDDYQYYVVVRMLGEVVGRSYLVMLSIIKPDWVEKAKFSYLWVFAVIQAALLLFFILAAWYRFLTSIWIVVVISFFRGVVIGVAYVNALAFFRDRFEGPHREFAMGYILVSIGLGSFVAALMGLITEPLLLDHCKTLVNKTDLCFTRARSLDRFSSVC
ncbi:PREDICTED: protein BTN1-like [Acropora digitifera]|uniref:protein BTN1-like n=1 Tax=Acropora digitifera TaxID=70779 RepID=UPI00077A2413|nr:PREDICTED: protein BTN1-like [Acropora digitifera]